MPVCIYDIVLSDRVNFNCLMSGAVIYGSGHYYESSVNRLFGYGGACKAGMIVTMKH